MAVIRCASCGEFVPLKGKMARLRCGKCGSPVLVSFNGPRALCLRPSSRV